MMNTTHSKYNKIEIPVPNELDNILEESYMMGKNIYLIFKDPGKVVIATIKQQHSTFRKEIGVLLKNKSVNTEDINRILNFIDRSHDIIYPNINNINRDQKKLQDITGKTDTSDLSDPSDKENIEIISISECIKLDSGEVKTRGIISSISEPFKMIGSRSTTCDCGSQNEVYTPPKFNDGLRKDFCYSCKSKKNIEYNYINAVSVELIDDEKFDELIKMKCILLEIDWERIYTGEKVTVRGKLGVINKKNKLISMLFSNSIEYENNEETIINEKDVESFYHFNKLKGSTTIESLVKMFDPFIVGLDLVKEGLLYGLVSSGNDLQSIKDHGARNRINVLLAGDPGVGKSSLLKKTAKLLKNSRYESCQHSSSLSLTAMVSKEEEHYSLRLGPIPLSKGSICALNEIGTMTYESQNHLLDIMEEGEFSVNKYGINAKIRAPTTIIASANTTNSQNSNGRNDDKISLSQIPLLKQVQDRFDLIIVEKNVENEEEIENYANKKTRLLSNKVPNYDNFLEKYIEYARKINVELSSESLNLITKYYIDFKKDNPAIGSKRLLETLIRLSKAVAKLKLKYFADAEDTKEALKFYNAVTCKYVNSVVSIPQAPHIVAFETCIQFLKKVEIPIPFEELVRTICQEDEFIKTYLFGYDSKITEHALKMENNTKIRKLYQMLCSDKNNIQITNRKPTAFQYLLSNVKTKYVSDRSDGSDIKDHLNSQPKNININDIWLKNVISKKTQKAIALKTCLIHCKYCPYVDPNEFDLGIHYAQYHRKQISRSNVDGYEVNDKIDTLVKDSFRSEPKETMEKEVVFDQDMLSNMG